MRRLLKASDSLRDTLRCWNFNALGMAIECLKREKGEEDLEMRAEKGVQKERGTA